jgi:glucosamine--fructose-6-phosphate aminotransferase (isomerizing)
MCGIFGGVFGKNSALRSAARLEACAERLFLLSESRGKEAAGFAIANQRQLATYKAPVSARSMIRSPAYRRQLRQTARAERVNGIAFIGHSRLVTDGGRELNRNNQPVLTGGIAGVHNGIIVNHAALWQRHTGLQRKFEVDSEVIFALLREQLSAGQAPARAVQSVYAELQGNASVAALFDDRDVLLLATNNGSLYYRHNPRRQCFIFGSESYIVDQFAEQYAREFGKVETLHLQAGQGVLVDLHTLETLRFSLSAAAPLPVAYASPALASASAPSGLAGAGALGATSRPPRSLLDGAAADPPPAAPPRSAAPLDLLGIEKSYPYLSMRDRLRRCTHCVLPETMPFIDFDERGVCVLCRTRGALAPVHGHAALEQLVAPYRRSDGRPDCIVGVSGGRDSIYGLHYLKRVLGLNPVAYTYDWGMVTDLARRNTARICGKLGIEHILVSADIPQKRAYIRANVEAWLARPALGTVPLFMAGDKAYFYYLSRVREQLGVQLAFLCENMLERTDFKTGFAGVPPVIHDADHAYTLPLSNKLELAAFYAKEFAANPRYFNSSLLDSAKAFAYYYVVKRDYHNLYRYVQWDEEIIESTLLEQYDFEPAPDTQSLWRIGDGTAAFYNYIYHAIAGMTENDTFRSNQIRQGMMDRTRALDLIERDNRPRFASIQWYLKTIGIERTVSEVLEIIERAPKLPARARAVVSVRGAVAG